MSITAAWHTVIKSIGSRLALHPTRGIVQPADDRLVEAMMVAEQADRGRRQIEAAGLSRAERDPPGGQDAQNVAVPEDEHVAGTRTDPADHPIGAGGDGVQRLPARAAVIEQLPSVPLGADVRR